LLQQPPCEGADYPTFENQKWPGERIRQSTLRGG
jgi:hypothetical protein